jgi:hypothetical protein
VLKGVKASVLPLRWVYLRQGGRAGSHDCGQAVAELVPQVIEKQRGARGEAKVIGMHIVVIALALLVVWGRLGPYSLN